MKEVCDFKKYYYDFLDIENAKIKNNIYFISTKNREEILNKEFLYPLIISKYNNKIYVSISPKYYKNFCNYINDVDLYSISEEKICNKILYFFSNILDEFEVKIMYRMCSNKKINKPLSNTLLLNEDTKQYFMNTGNKSSDIEFKENKWNEMKYLINKNSVYIISKDEKIISMAYISDIFYGGANIVVNTDNRFRNLGYGKSVVASVNNFALDNQLIPIYYVNRENIKSISIANSLGLEKMAKEIVVCIKK